MSKKTIRIEILPRALWVVHGFCLYLGQYFTNSPPLLTDNAILFGLGTFLMITGFSLWIWVGKHIKRALITKDLITSGPYKYVRHPMYVALYIALFGAGFLFFSWVWVVIMVIFIPIWYLDCRIEEKQMFELHGEEYQDYKRRVGMFLPKHFFVFTKRKPVLKEKTR